MEILKDTIRQNSLYKLGLSERPKVLNILDKLKDLKQFKDDDYPDSVFLGNSKKDIYMEQDLKNNTFYISHDEIWSVLESKFGLNFTDIQLLTQWILRLPTI